MKLNKYIDHTLLKQDCTKEGIIAICEEAKKYDFASVCVNPSWVSFAKNELAGTNVDICTVIGFPLGANTTDVKTFETLDAIKNGATEIDMVINISRVKEGDYEYVLNEINELKAACNNRILKVIVETSLLTESEKELICRTVVKSNADFIKTSTGMTAAGATVEDIELFKSICKEDCKIKASGGVRSFEDAQKFIKAGADRLGTSGGVNIINGLENKETY